MFLVLFSLGTLACAENNKTGEEKFCTSVQNVSADAIVSKLKRDGATILCVCDKDDRQSIYYSKLIESEDSWAYTELFRYDLRTNMWLIFWLNIIKRTICNLSLMMVGL